VIVIGAVFLVLAALAVVAAVVTGRDVRVTLDGFGVHSTTSVLWVFCAGAIAMLLLLLALSAFRRAARRRRNQRRELRQLRAEEALAAENRAAEDRDKGDHRAESTVDVRNSDADETRAFGDARAQDPGPERRYVPGDERS
jgi:flagellar biosynthesis/type III secretory pathway M-ring protein FliF/YscJ